MTDHEFREEILSDIRNLRQNRHITDSGRLYLALEACRLHGQITGMEARTLEQAYSRSGLLEYAQRQEMREWNTLTLRATHHGA